MNTKGHTTCIRFRQEKLWRRDNIKKRIEDMEERIWKKRVCYLILGLDVLVRCWGRYH